MITIDKGWVKLHRELMDKAIWKCSTVEQKVILLTLLMMANHKENEWEWQGKKFRIKAGQFITSSKSIEENAGPGITRQNVRTALEKFGKHEFLTKESTKTGMLITIVNWELYQSSQEEVTKPLTINQPTGNQQVTNDQPTGNQRVTTNKNDKNEKNDKNDKNEKNKGHKALIEDYTNNPDLRESLAGFVEMRRASKKPPTDRALMMIFRELDKLGKSDSEKTAIVNQSIMHNWASVFPLKQGSYTGKKPQPKDFTEREYDYNDLENRLLGWK